MNDTPKTLLQAVQYFADPKVCFEAMLQVKWPDGKIVCPHCNSDRIGTVSTRSLLRCKDCRKQIRLKQGTIFEDSPLSFQKWFVAIWSIANCKNGISSLELSRALGVRQPTAWFMLHRIRAAMKTKTFNKLSGEVEVDETFIGGRARNMHKAKREKRIRGRGTVGKAIVQGLLERGGEARMAIVSSTEDETLCRNVRRNVADGSKVYSDALPAYSPLALNFFHAAVDHLRKYVIGRVHTNGLENFWSLLKRALKGTYVAVAPFHLERYLDEQTFRYNERDTDDAGRFRRVLNAVVGKRLTYRVLTAKDDAGFMGLS
jgi:transposase-like protein